MDAHPNLLKRKLLRFALTLLLLAAIFGSLAILAIIAGGDQLAVALSVPPTSTISAEEYCAQWRVFGPTAPPGINELQEYRYQTCLEGFRTRLTPKPVLPRRLTFEAPHTIVAPTDDTPRTPAGAGAIIDRPGDARFGPLYEIQNSWIFEAQGKRYEVLAGAKREEGPPQPRNTMQGIVVVWVSTLKGEVLPEAGFYNVPIRKGPVKIVGAQGQTVILQTDDGTKFYFDLPTRRFVSTLGTPTPISTPTRRPYP